ncbi:MAG: DUF2062 domain-containing protein [Planctomycetes bacterium]|nr:DUF2062 domain-containing protein [Planctomycetota bacterium]
MVRSVHINGRKWFRKVLGLNDTPESIAASTAIGIFVAWTPTIGIQMIISFALCAVARVNRIAGPLMAWITNPVTIPPIFYFNYLVGSWILHSEGDAGTAGKRMDAAWETMGTVSMWDFLTFNGPQINKWFDEMLHLGAEIMVPLMVGSILVGLVLGLAAYPLTVRAVRAFRAARQKRGVFWKAHATGAHLPAVSPAGNGEPTA